MQTGITLTSVAVCGALLWALGAAHSQMPRYSAQSATPAAHAQTMHAECNGWGGKAVARTELFFGLTRPGGATVTAEEFQRFVEREVTPRFPAGSTLLGGDGQFRHADGTLVKENAKVLILLYPYDRESHHKIEFIRAAYAQAFAQESVLRVDGNACVSF